MFVHVIASGSKANCYVIESESEALVLECGVPFAKVIKALNYQPKIKGVLLTHEHGDHAKYAKEYATRSILHGTDETLGVLGITRGKAVEYSKTYSIGSFRVMPFKVKHDAVKPCGYLICHKECGNILFATDTYYIPVLVEEPNTLMIECNYVDEMLQDNYDNGIVDPTRYKRVLYSHMGLNTCLDYLKGYKAEQLCKSNIILIHTSTQNSKADVILSKIEQEIGLQDNVYVATYDTTININTIPF